MRRLALNENPSSLSFAARMELQRQNRSRFETYRDMTGEQLPAPVVVATPERVYVTVSDADDLVAWLDVYGGTAHRGPVFDGMRMWTVHQVSDGWSDGRSVPVQITAAVQEDELVMHVLMDALVQSAPVVSLDQSPQAVSA